MAELPEETREAIREALLSRIKERERGERLNKTIWGLDEPDR
jgi:hypothetical protein